ncbi:methyl-accepting chemotaxis sensory transducer with Cache sensor [Breoghania corrubedonensis]|uniref:Methyl-accepting chemotaxis sensory transducer with Cache sensor n=1 Tax=Breoghania corrubedonensis TaxID=665038 RepID=A0A2T5VBJ6_9HYPH|nr:methyl-accepting chemotaxis protein [Breoghania corrubedonensis]PTW61109.1 methyl-accepting chemotaxis sensory transducer with Cache sensor [Breoghania corrubedonensis]
MPIRTPRSLSGKLYGLVVFFTLCFVVMLAYQMYALYTNLEAFKRTEIRSVVESAKSIAVAYGQRAESGEMSDEEARARALAAIRAIRYNGKNYVFIYQSDGNTVLRPTRPEQEGTSRFDVKDPAGRHYVRDFINAATVSGGGYVNYGWESPKKKTFQKTSYIAYYKPWDWVFGSGVLMVDMETIFWSEAVKSAGLTLVFMGISLALAFLLARSLAKPIRRLNQQMEAIANDVLEHEVEGVERTDEIGEMSRAVAVFRTNALERHRLEGLSAEARAAREQRQNQIEAMITDFKVDVENALDVVNQNSGRLDDAAKSLKANAAHTESSAADASQASERASQNVQTVASAAEELAASIGEITRQVSQSNEVVSKATSSAKQSNAKVASLDEAAQKIGEVVSLIQAIAEQTNLLALNATIEAARAGEAGKGFAVVAAEVKELANQTSKATEEISAHVGAIQGSTKETVEVIEQIAAIMEEVNGYTTAIADAVEQQGLATAEISENVQAAASGTRKASDNMIQLTNTATDTTRTAEFVLDASGQMSSSTADLSKRINHFLSRVATT